MKKKILFLVLSIFIVVLILFSSSYALLFKSDVTDKQSYTTGILDITSEVLNGSVTLSNELPMTDSDGENTTPYTFRITNTGNLSYKFNIMLLSTTTENQIESEYIKIKVDDNTPVKLNSLTNGVILSEILLEPTEYVDITLRVWLDEYTPNTQIGKTFNAKITTEGQAIYTSNSLDKSDANSPDLVQGLIPVMYDGSEWVKADETNLNETYKWYDYDNKLWANAVLVTSTNRSTYQNASAGATINESDILAYYVWIPRYKYKVWNISKQAGAESTYAYNAYTEGIDIVFENEKETTGTINCTYNFNVDTSNGGIDLSTTTAETCTGSNGDYYTHPAFTFGSDELRGFWIGKFETSSSNPNTAYGGGPDTSLTVRSLPNVRSWGFISLGDINTVIQNMQISNNIYGLSTSRANTDSHMLKNMEWGAVAYLTNSKYGRCTNNSCSKVEMNGYGVYSGEEYNNTITGCGPISSGSTSVGTTCNEYNTTLGMTASTTGNITGVYDMSGGSDEFVMGNMSSVTSNYTFYPKNSGFSTSWYASNQKYLDTYAYDAENSKNQTAYNRGRLGDATAEVVLIETYNGSWYSGCSYFLHDSHCVWFLRGGYYDNGYCAGLFYFSSTDGSFQFVYYSSRMALASISN